jgi:hypothetical protein
MCSHRPSRGSSARCATIRVTCVVWASSRLCSFLARVALTRATSSVTPLGRVAMARGRVGLFRPRRQRARSHRLRLSACRRPRPLARVFRRVRVKPEVLSSATTLRAVSGRCAAFRTPSSAPIRAEPLVSAQRRLSSSPAMGLTIVRVANAAANGPCKTDGSTRLAATNAQGMSA